MSLRAVTCESCGGAVVLEAGKSVPACLFCGAEKLAEAPVAEGIEPPQSWLPFSVEAEGARASFKKAASASFWYPGEVRNAEVALHRLYLPAWAWSGRVETHWAALVSGATRSGKRPVTGSDQQELAGVMVPSSTAVTRDELAAISPFDMEKQQELKPGEPDEPYEPGQLTPSGARAAGIAALRARHESQIKARLHSHRFSASGLVHNSQGAPLLLPVWIGSWRWKDKVYRVVINGQTARLTGAFPYSWLKITIAVLLVLGLIGFALLICGGGAALSQAR